MLTVVALRAQIASVVDALSKAAVAEISKVVEDGIAALRMEMCHREDEIQKLKRSVQVLHSELGAARKPGTLRPEPRCRNGELPVRNPKQPGSPSSITFKSQSV